MPIVSEEIVDTLALKELQVLPDQTKSSQDSCFSKQVETLTDDSGAKVYTEQTKKLLSDSIVSVYPLVSAALDSLNFQKVQATNQIDVLRKRKDAIQTGETSVLNYLTLTQAINQTCPETAETSLQVRLATDSQIAEQQEIEYRITLAIKTQQNIDTQLKATRTTLDRLNSMKLALR